MNDTFDWIVHTVDMDKLVVLSLYVVGCDTEWNHLIQYVTKQFMLFYSNLILCKVISNQWADAVRRWQRDWRYCLYKVRLGSSPSQRKSKRDRRGTFAAFQKLLFCKNWCENLLLLSIFASHISIRKIWW
jgi:hypothetical protein